LAEGEDARMTEIDAGDQEAVTAHVGDTVVVRLAENPSTGFTWTIAITGAGVVVADYSPAGGSDPRPGAPGQRTFVLNATTAGDADVVLTLARPWEAGAASQTRRLRVTVEA
jgi:inhibitor of cysteine peptidase